MSEQTTGLSRFAGTDLQKRVLNLLDRGVSVSWISNTLSISRKSVWRIQQAAKRRADLHVVTTSPQTSVTTPDVLPLSGTSTLYDRDGNQRLTWVKTKVDESQRLEAFKSAIDALRDEIPRVAPTPANTMGVDAGDLLNMYLITDYHLGALAWGEETGGEDWDIKLAESLLVRWFDTAVSRAPRAGTAVLAQLGDFLHWDGHDPVTPTSRNLLDADTRYQKLVRTSIRVIRRVIQTLLANHSRVHVLMAEGNHDLASSAWLRELLSIYYETDPRVTVEVSPDPYYAYQHGQTLLLFHHGHMRGIDKGLDAVLVSKYRELYGRSDYVYGHVGHHHHDKVVESALLRLEQHRTLAAPDAYASRGGWMSGRDAKVITYSAQHGEVYRATISPALATDRGAK